MFFIKRSRPSFCADLLSSASVVDWRGEGWRQTLGSGRSSRMARARDEEGPVLWNKFRNWCHSLAGVTLALTKHHTLARGGAGVRSRVTFANNVSLRGLVMLVHSNNQ